MEHDPAPAVSLDILERDVRPGLLDRALAALRAERLVGVVGRDDVHERLGALAGALAIDESGLALVATDDGVVSGLSLETIAARLSRALDAAVMLGAPDGSEGGPGLESEAVSVLPPGFDPDVAFAERADAAPPGDVRAVSLVPLAADRLAERLPELARSVSGTTAIVPAGERSLVVTDAPMLPTWWRGAKPAVSLMVGPNVVELLVWLDAPIERRRPLLQRLSGEPDWGIAWGDHPVGIQRADAPQAAIEAQAALRGGDELDVPSAVAERLGWAASQVDALRSLWSEPASSVSVHRIVDAIGAPEPMARLASGADAALEPGAVAYAPAGMGTTLLDAMTAATMPKGVTAWSRWELWWWRRPRLWLAAGVTMLLLVTLLVGGMASSGEAPWWRIVLAAAVAINGFGAVGGALLAMRSARGARV